MSLKSRLSALEQAFTATDHSPPIMSNNALEAGRQYAEYIQRPVPIRKASTPCSITPEEVAKAYYDFINGVMPRVQ